MEKIELAGEVAGYASGIAALGSLGFTVGKQLLKKQLTKAAWTVTKAVVVIGGTIAADKAVEAGARALGASEETIRGIRLASLVIGVILTHRRMPVAAEEAAELEAQPLLEEQPGGSIVPPVASPM